jgi:hypothetical protein
MNDAVYWLAEANAALDRAAEWSAKATKDLEQKTFDLSLDNAEVKDFGEMTALAAYWDTLGW